VFLPGERLLQDFADSIKQKLKQMPQRRIVKELDFKILIKARNCKKYWRN